jgi:bifunctional non-homologous end joining protein LigD
VPANGGAGIPEVAPQLATSADAPPPGDGWIHEIKYDGYRLLCRIEDGRARLISRNAKDWTARFPDVIEAAESLPVENAILDGEVAVVQPDGRTSFQALQNAAAGRSGTGVLRYFLFDLPFLDGEDLTAKPLIERKAALAALLESVGLPILHYSDHVEGSGRAFFQQACRYGLEGIVCKRRDGPYRPGRSKDWLKVKCQSLDEFVVGGFTEPSGARAGFGAFLIGGHDAAGRLRFAGRVGTGFTDSQLQSYRKRLDSLERDQSPFTDGPEGRAARGMHWVEPVLVAQVAYTEITDDGVVRHPSFKGLREDRPATEVLHPEYASSTEPPDPPPEPDDPSPPAAQRRTGRGRRKQPALEIEGIAISNPDKVMYPDAGVTKRELCEYYAHVAAHMLPIVADRTLTLVRCPNGITDCFYQKHIEGTVPEAIIPVPVREGDADSVYAAVDSAAGLVALSQLGVLEIHTWGSRRADLERPDRFTLDFDPDPKVPWIRVVEAVLETRGFLGELGLDSFLKTTGGKGLHVVVPVRPDLDWAGIKEFSRSAAAAVTFDNPGKYTLSMSKEKRRDRILIDYLRNGRGATAIEAYSTRARPGAPVAVPIRWDELADGIRGDTFDIRTTRERVDALTDDPWSGYGQASRQRITAAMRRKVGMDD